MKNYSPLTPSLIEELEKNGNHSPDWSNVWVTDDFVTENIHCCVFIGETHIGQIDGMTSSPSGIRRKCMLIGTQFIDCSIGDRVFVSNTGSYIANYKIEDEAYIENCSLIETTTQSTFGNGTEVAAVNESGGREVAIFDYLSAQSAYMMAMYRHREKVVERITKFVHEYSQSVRSSKGTIAKGASMLSCGIVRNVRIGEAAALCGVVSLENGTVNSTNQDITYVGVGVIARDFIFASGARVDTGANISRSFVGQGSIVDNGFSCVDSLFFANSYMSNGEACSIFAGPYTVSHHRSTLLIAGLFSFFNAGSGTNQSNHLFKTGAVHQGAHARGCKFSSGAYVMLPAREGAFTMVMGKHAAHHDTESFPFSYLIESEGHSLLMPAANLRSFGTVRDIDKWGKRDRRKAEKLDRVSFDRYNPYLGERIMEGMAAIKELTGKGDMVIYNRVRIKANHLKRGYPLYEMELAATLSALLSGEAEADEAGAGHWIDMAGMYAPQSAIEQIMDNIESGKIASISALEQALDKIFFAYNAYAKGWVMAQIGSRSVKDIIDKGIKARQMLKDITDEDARKDAELEMMVSYGIDDAANTEKDFKNVRKL